MTEETIFRQALACPSRQERDAFHPSPIFTPDIDDINRELADAAEADAAESDCDVLLAHANNHIIHNRKAG